MVQPVKRIVKVDQKKDIVAGIKSDIENSASLVLTAYKGLTVEEISDLRAKLAEVGGRFRVLKNTLVSRAVSGTNLEPLQEHLFGTTAVMFAGDDPVMPVKALAEFTKKHEKLEIKAGAIEGKPLSREQVIELSKLPTKEELLAKLLGSVNAPATNLVYALSGVVRKLVHAIEQIRQQKEAAA